MPERKRGIPASTDSDTIRFGGFQIGITIVTCGELNLDTFRSLIQDSHKGRL